MFHELLEHDNSFLFVSQNASGNLGTPFFADTPKHHLFMTFFMFSFIFMFSFTVWTLHLFMCQISSGNRGTHTYQISESLGVIAADNCEWEFWCVSLEKSKNSCLIFSNLCSEIRSKPIEFVNHMLTTELFLAIEALTLIKILSL